MLRRRNFILTAIAGMFLLLTNPLFAQEVYVLASGSNLEVAGTSTLHDWEMKTDGAAGEATIKLNGQQITGISEMEIAFAVNSLKSGKGQMDNIAHETLKEEKHPKIRFELTEVKQLTGNTVKAAGNLTIAGTTRPVILEVNYEVKGNTIRFTGTHKIKFTDFKVDPPKAMFGTIKTGDELTLSFFAAYKAANQGFNQ